MALFINELNDYASKLEASKEQKKKTLPKNEASKHDLEMTMHELEETMYEF